MVALLSTLVGTLTRVAKIAKDIRLFRIFTLAPAINNINARQAFAAPNIDPRFFADGSMKRTSTISQLEGDSQEKANVQEEDKQLTSHYTVGEKEKDYERERERESFNRSNIEAEDSNGK